MTNFDSWAIDYSANYGGSDKKIGLLSEAGERHMLKMAEAVPERVLKSPMLSIREQEKTRRVLWYRN